MRAAEPIFRVMAVDVRVEVRIERPRADVARYMFDPENDAEWTTGVVESRPLDAGPLRVGSRVERVTKFLGRRFAYTYEVVAIEPERAVEMRVTQPFPMHIRYELEDAESGTLASIRARGEPGGFFRIAAPLMTSKVRSNIQKDLELLRDTLMRSR